MKQIDLHARTRRPVLGATMPPSIARIPLVDLCTCKHPRESHEHWHDAEDCAQCECSRFRRWEPVGV